MDLEMFIYKRYAVVAKYTGTEPNVQIPDVYKGVPVTGIREKAFAHNTKVQRVFLPNTIEVIETGAFEGCTCLTYVGPCLDEAEFESNTLSQLPRILKLIESRAFAESSVENLSIKSDSIVLGDSVFEDCPLLNRVEFPYCQKLYLGKSIFRRSGISALYIPMASVTVLPNSMFAECVRLEEVQLNFAAVGDYSFFKCNNLRMLSIEKPIKKVGMHAFDGCEKLYNPNLPTIHSLVKPLENGAISPFSDEAIQIATHVLDKINSEKKIEKKENSPNVEAGTENKKTLFLLKLSDAAKVIEMPNPLRGKFLEEDQKLLFQIKYPSQFSSLKLQCVDDGHFMAFRPFIAYLQAHSISVHLFGKQQAGLYAVYDVQDDSPDSPLGYSVAFFHKMITQRLQSVPKPARPKEDLQLYAMHGLRECEAYTEICKDILPSWVLSAYYKNSTIAYKAVGSSDAKEHALHAIELLLNIDWMPKAMDVPTVTRAKQILDNAFYGLQEVKLRIMEVISQIRRTGLLPKWGILLHGPAGTGKTSIAKVIADLMGMPIIQMDMSTIGESAETISGTSRIYTNAREGLLLEGMFSVRSSTAVLLANEIDKASNKNRQASSTLLTILDKTGFYENFLEEVIPTDNLFCIGTCNDLDKVPKPLKDRFLVINIPGYSPEEKKIIWNNYALPRAMARSSIAPEQLGVTEEAAELLVSSYALESGVRDLEQYAERLIGDYCRAADLDEQYKHVYSADDIKTLLGPGRRVKHSYVGVAGEVNAAFYHHGEAYFFMVEASVRPGNGKFEVLGPMAKIQEEYCKVAYLCVGNTTCDLSKYDISIFIPYELPEGSHNHVGMACYAAICSKLANINLANNTTCFIGGCDMNGSLYFSESDLGPLLKIIKAKHIKTLYAPIGTGQLLDPSVTGDWDMTVVEAPDAKTLFSLAALGSTNQ